MKGRRTLDLEVTIKLSGRGHGRRDRTVKHDSPEPEPIARITRLMALAIKLQDMVDRGEVRDYADLSRLGFVTRARVTQIMNMLNLAPDVQEAILFGAGESTPARETQLRPVVRFVHWADQKRALAALEGTH